MNALQAITGISSAHRVRTIRTFSKALPPPKSGRAARRPPQTGRRPRRCGRFHFWCMRGCCGLRLRSLVALRSFVIDHIESGPSRPASQSHEATFSSIHPVPERCRDRWGSDRGWRAMAPSPRSQPMTTQWTLWRIEHLINEFLGRLFFGRCFAVTRKQGGRP
jgi:hypothetical protein